MKTNKLFLLSMILGLSFGLLAQSQNGVWSLTPKYSKITTSTFQPPISLPTSPGFPGFYNGHAIQNASNSMLDANDELLFFIVDNDIYDGDGEIIGNIENYY